MSLAPVRHLTAALRFLTRIPVPGPPTRVEDLPGSLTWWPLVGATVGLLVGGTFVAAAQVWPAPAAAVVAVAVGLVVSGAFHEDAAADSADGLGGGFTPARVLAIMKDSRVGTYGVVTLWCLLGLRATALVALGAGAPWGLALAMAFGRWTAAPWLRGLPGLSRGLGREVGARTPASAVLGASLTLLLLALGYALLGQPRLGPAALGAAGATLAWGIYLRRRLGGQTGDLLGAGNQLVEAVVLLVLLAR